MSFVWTLFWFIVAVGLLVTVHEFGHFWVARRLGFKVLRFSVGVGPPLHKWVRGADRVEYVVAAIPLGGYMKMLDEREGPVPSADLPRSFTRRPPWQRIAVLLAGPAFNILFAIIALWGIFWVNGVNLLRPHVGEVTAAAKLFRGLGFELGVPPVLGGVDAGGPAARAGLAAGDRILAIDGVPM